PAEQLKKLLAAAPCDRIEICDAPDVIGMHESPTLAVRHKVASSLVQAMLAVKDGRAQALVSAGSTGAILAGAILRIGRIRGIDRPALAVILPGRKKPFMLLDCGANVDCQPQYLSQFGLMGAVYMEKVMGVQQSDVRLVNIGLEAEKGNKLAKDAFILMQSQSVYHFGGNIEAREVPMGACDVVVADGFDGNLILKYTEGLSSAMVGMLKEELMKNAWTKLGALIVKPALRAFKGKLSSEEYGGAPLLGVKGALVKAHGSADAKTIMNAVRQARTMIEGDIVSLTEKGVAQMTQAAEEAKA
ncbi:MAG: phosphate acyltransferase PlsX, partial [Clostridia bacterium]